MVEIFWLGNSAIKIVTKESVIGINPKTGEGFDLILTSKASDIKPTEEQFMISTPGEYQAKSAMIYTLIEDGARESKAFQLIVDGISFFYTDNLEFMPTKDQLDNMSTTDIAFIPLSVDKEKEKNIQKLTEAIEPRIVIPLASDDEVSAEACTMLAKTLGLKCEETVNSYKIKNKSQLPDDEQLFVSLDKV